MNKAVTRTNKRKVLEWAAYLLFIGAILYLFAPGSWWQFGVTAAGNRKAAANFSLRPLEGGKSWDFADQRGRVVLVNYWATWCPACRVETPGLVSLRREFGSRELEIVGVTVNGDRSSVPAFVKKYGIHYQILIPGGDPNVASGGLRLPATFLYDKKGRLAKKYTGFVFESTFRSDIARLLEEE